MSHPHPSRRGLSALIGRKESRTRCCSSRMSDLVRAARNGRALALQISATRGFLPEARNRDSRRGYLRRGSPSAHRGAHGGGVSGDDRLARGLARRSPTWRGRTEGRDATASSNACLNSRVSPTHDAGVQERWAEVLLFDELATRRPLVVTIFTSRALPRSPRVSRDARMASVVLTYASSPGPRGRGVG